MKPRTIAAMMRISVAVCGLALIGAQAVEAQSLRSALTSAYDNSNLLEQNRALLRATDEDVAVALSALRPQISAQAGLTHTDPTPNTDSLSKTIDLTLQMLLYDFGRTRLGVEAAKETVLAGRANLREVERAILLNAVNAYLAVVRDMRVVMLRENNLRLITQELRAARDRFEVGEVTRTDVAQAEARLAEAVGAQADAQGNLQISKATYKAATGTAAGSLEGLTTLPPMPATPAQAIDLGLRNSPLVDQAQHQIRANELNVAAAQAATRPSLRGTARLGYDNSRDANSSVGIQLTVPIYQGGQLSALTRRARAVAQASRSNLHQVTRQVRLQIEQSWSELQVAKAQLTSSARQIRAAQVAFDGVREEARLGSRTTLDVLNAEQALLDARTDRVVFETQVYGAAYRLLDAVGQLNADFLNLPVARYDPNTSYNSVKTAPVPLSKQGKKLNRILQRYEKK